MRKMKDSGIEWIGEIPQEWKMTKVKKIFDIGRGRVIATTELSDNGYPVFSSQTKNNGILGYIDTYDFDRSQLTWTTDGANAGTVFIREGKHNCTNVCGTLMPKNNTNELKYLYYCLGYIAFFHKRADINGYKIMNNEMAEIELLLPAIAEQQKISAFLDRKCTEIDSVISKTKATIEEYKKLKQSVITQAVTKGIIPNRPMKDSIVEFNDNIPIDWNEVKLKYLCYLRARLGWRGLKADEYVESGYIFLSAFNIINNKLDFSEVNYINQFRYDESPEIKLRLGDILIVKDGAGIGKCAYIDYMPKESTPNGSLAVITPNNNLYGKYLYYFFLSNMFQNRILQLKDGMGVPHLFQGDMREIIIPVPPKDEQQEIVNYLDEKCSEIDKLIAKKEQLLTEMENYKKAVIYEYVTGKKEVE